MSRPKFTVTFTASDLHTQGSSLLPTAAQDGVPSNFIRKIHSVSASLQCAATDQNYRITIYETNTGLIAIHLGKTFLANEWDTLLASFVGGIPIWGQTASGPITGASRSTRSLPDGDSSVLFEGTTAPAAGYVIIAYDWVPQGAVRV